MCNRFHSEMRKKHALSKAQGLPAAFPAFCRGYLTCGRSAPQKPCGLARGKARLGTLGLGGRDNGRFEHFLAVLVF